MFPIYLAVWDHRIKSKLTIAEKKCIQKTTYILYIFHIQQQLLVSNIPAPMAPTSLHISKIQCAALLCLGAPPVLSLESQMILFLNVCVCILIGEIYR